MSSIKIIVMGVGGVGKSAITNRFVIGRWVEKVRVDKLVSFARLIVILQKFSMILQLKNHTRQPWILTERPYK